MKRLLLLLALAFAYLVLAPIASHAQGRCGPRADIIKALSDRYKEFPHATGTINDQAIMEVFTSHTGTWTFIVTDTHGQTCIVGAGDSWDALPDPPKGQGT